jgi:pyruvate/2-oxoglutarate dehydrogenase complex dihydrolipoamide dehydrogenase (E3) component
MSGSADSVYDVIVVGTGPIGQTVAQRARAAGLSVAAVERELVGGECSYWACIPSKAVTGPVDAPAVFTRRDGYVTDWDDSGQAGFLKSIGAELFRGHGRLDGPRRVTVRAPDGQEVSLTARHAVAICQ